MCLGERASNDSEELDTRDQRLNSIQRPASGIWGWESVRPADHLDAPPDIDCNSRDIPSLLAESDAALNALEAGFDEHSTMVNKGFWIGNLALCGSGPVKAEVIVDELNEMSALLITLDRATSAELAVLTERNVGHSLAIRANGAILMEPNIHESLKGGQFQIVGPDRAELEKLAAMLSQCAG